MWTPTEFSYRKFVRKADAVGYPCAALAAAELVSRRVALDSVVDRLCDRGTFETLSPASFHASAEAIHSVTDESTAYGPLSAPFVAEFAPGYIFSGTGLATNEALQLLNEPLFPPERGRRFVVAKLIWQLFHEPTRLTTALRNNDLGRAHRDVIEADTVAPLIPRYSDNYYHWTVETVPKIRYLREYEAQTGVDLTYLVPGDAPGWLDETIELIGVSEGKIERATGPIYRADRLVLPSFPVQTWSDYEWFVETVRSSVDRSGVTANGVFISRANAPERRIVNENAVAAALADHGIERQLLEDNTVAENIALFAEADVVVGAHGAGLTDLLYCEDATVIELFGSKLKDPYERLAATAGVEYESMRCRPVSTDLHVDPDALVGRIERCR